MKKNLSDDFFVSSLINKIKVVKNKNITLNTDFLDLNLFNIAISVLNKYKCNYFVFDFNDFLERKVIYILNDNNYYDLSNIKCLEIVNLSCRNIFLKHKDYMGALYNLGVNTDKFSDIFVLNDRCYVFVLDDVIVNFVKYNLDRIGKASVSINVISDFDDINIKREFDNFNVFASSLRLDLFISKLCKLSRNDSSIKINNNDVVINSKIICNKIYEIKVNDIIAVRKYGKFIIKDISFKNKYIINVDKYK